MYTPRTLALALVFTFLMCSMFVGCSSSAVPPEQPDVVDRSTAGACGDNVWMTTGSLANARENATAVRLWNGTVVVAGGLWTDQNDPSLTGPVADAEQYNPTTGSWSAAGTLHVPRYGHGAVGLKDTSGNVKKILVVGGTLENGDPTETAEIYDSGTNSWTQVGSMHFARFFPQVTLLSDGKVLVSGGQGLGFQTLKSAEVFDPAQGTWLNVGDMHDPRFGAGAALLPNGNVLVAGGSYNFTHLQSAEIYDPIAKTWANTASMAAGRYTSGLVTLKSGKVLAAGGTDDAAGAEVYTPASGTTPASWSPASGMSHPARYFFQTIPLADGRVMVAGGLENGLLTDSVELYDTDLGQWVPNNPMNNARYLAVATELLDGRILSAAGYAHESTGAENDTGAAETFVPCPPDKAPVALCKNVTVNLTDTTANTCYTPPDAATSVDNGSYDPDNQPGPWSVYQWAPPPYVGLGDHAVTLVANDGLLQTTCSATVTVKDLAKPNIECPVDQTLECNNQNGGTTAPTFTPQSVSDNCGGGTATCADSGKTLALGTHQSTCTATDGSGNQKSCTFNVTVQDTKAPITGTSKNILLWPADGALHEITLMDCANFTVDACHGRLNPLNFNGGVITSVTADEPDDAPGNRDGATTGDVQIKKPWLALVRAERDTTRNGRVYTINYQVTDPSSNTATGASCKVFVPVNQGSTAIDDQIVSNCIDNPNVAGSICP